MTVTFCGHGNISYSVDIRSVFVMPYLNRDYDTELYDESIYPNIEHIPKRLAIIKRNEYMVDAADIVVAYVEHDWGGAAKTLKYAKKEGKKGHKHP